MSDRLTRILTDMFHSAVLKLILTPEWINNPNPNITYISNKRRLTLIVVFVTKRQTKTTEKCSPGHYISKSLRRHSGNSIKDKNNKAQHMQAAHWLDWT